MPRQSSSFCIVFGVSVALSACVGAGGARQPILQIPVTGQLSNGSAAAGQATAFSDGQGEFWVQVPGAERCSGTYNVRDPNPTIVVPVSCGNGKRGEAVITRQADLVSGTAIVSLNDKTRGRFVFGRLTFDQVFGDGGRAKTQ